jgi:hypothetical protein
MMVMGLKICSLSNPGDEDDDEDECNMALIVKIPVTTIPFVDVNNGSPVCL